MVTALAMSGSMSANTRWVAGEKVESTAGDPKMPEFAGPAAGAGEPNTPEFELGELN
jgi:hypothetical protein